MANYLGIDVGGTNIKFALMNEEGEILEKGEVATPKTDIDEFVETLGKIYDHYKDTAEGLAMSAPGRIDANRGFMYTGGALQFIKDNDLKSLLAKRIPVPFAVENDAKAAALAEIWKGALKGYNSGSVIVLGTGIGGAIMLDGKLWRGNTFAAGEYSGIAARWDEKMDGMKYGWAGVNSTSNLVKMYAKAIDADPKTLDGRMFFERVNAGDLTAVNVLHDFCATLATGIASLQLILDVQRFCIGGGISKQPVLMQVLTEEVNDLYDRMPFYNPSTKPEVVTCEFGNDANMIGALYHYLHELNLGR